MWALAVALCMFHDIQQSMDQPGSVANPARGQLSREKCFFFLSPFAPENLISRDWFGHPIPRQLAHSPLSGLISCTVKPLD